MKVEDFLTDLGDVLQEDYVTNPVWTKAEVFGYVQQVTVLLLLHLPCTLPAWMISRPTSACMST